MKVYVNSDQSKWLNAHNLSLYHDLGLDIVIEVDGDPIQEPPVEESIGQDENGNEIFVPVEYGNE